MARLQVSRSKEPVRYFDTLVYIIVDIPQERFDYPDWSPGDGFFEVSRGGFVKEEEDRFIIVSGPFPDYTKETVRYGDDSEYRVYTRIFPKPLNDDGEYALSEMYNKPRRSILAGLEYGQDAKVFLTDLMDSGMLTMEPYEGHPLQVRDNAFSFEKNLSYGFEPDRIIGVEWGITGDIGKSIIYAPEGCLSVVLEVDFGEWIDGDHYGVRKAVEFARRWGGKVRVLPFDGRLSPSCLYDYRAR